MWTSNSCNNKVLLMFLWHRNSKCVSYFFNYFFHDNSNINLNIKVLIKMEKITTMNPVILNIIVRSFLLF